MGCSPMTCITILLGVAFVSGSRVSGADVMTKLESYGDHAAWASLRPNSITPQIALMINALYLQFMR